MTICPARSAPHAVAGRLLVGEPGLCRFDVGAGLADCRPAHDGRPVMNAWAVRGWILFAVLLALLYGGFISLCANRQADQAIFASHTSPAAEPDHVIEDFTLTDQSGQPFGSAELKGKVWIASFFFASCPATCRQLNQALAGVQAATPDDVILVSLTCDPDNDSPEVLSLQRDLSCRPGPLEVFERQDVRLAACRPRHFSGRLRERGRTPKEPSSSIATGGSAPATACLIMPRPTT